jgi:hypothetical protein
MWMFDEYLHKEVNNMDISKLTHNKLAEFTANLVALLSGPELASIDPAVRADLVTAFGTLPADLANQTAAAAAIDNEKQSAFSTKDETAFKLIVLGRQTRDHLKAAQAPKSEFELAGFDFPETRANQYVAQIPSNLAVVGFSNGVNTGEFVGNNRSGAVVYEVWRREGDEGAWRVHIFTRKQSFKDEGVTPGQYYEYRVRASASNNASDFSNTAVVYGVV